MGDVAIPSGVRGKPGRGIGAGRVAPLQKTGEWQFILAWQGCGFRLLKGHGS